MILRVRLFARARDLAGSEMVEVRVADGASIGELRRTLASQFPVLAELLPRCALAVGDEFAGDAVVLSSPAEVAVLPPVSGGAGQALLKAATPATRRNVWRRPLGYNDDSR
jgi:molybdopterin converting factor small subunit